MTTDLPVIARPGGWLIAAMAAGSLVAACAPGEDDHRAAGQLTTSAQAEVMAPNCPQQFVMGYYGGYYAFNPDYQAPQHVDMTAMTHFVYAHIRPGGGQFGGAPGEVVLGDAVTQTVRSLGPGAPYRTIEEYLIGRAHQVGTKALVMLGGAGEEAGFRASLAPSVRPTFITNLVNFMVSRDYDGLEVDFEGFLNTNDEALLEAFIVEIRAAADAHPRYATRPVIITYPSGLKNMNIDHVTAHDRRVADLVDYYNLMSYGAGWFGQGWASTVSSPLTGYTPYRPMDIASTIQAYVDAGVPRCKLGMGIGFYGMMYKPPFTGPDEPTDGDLSKWSTNDNVWNFAQLTKRGFLDNGTYVWHAATQTGYRSYPGGYTPADGGTAVGYISYEDQAGIAAKGAWAKSGAPDAGAGGTIIWLVNYGTTNGVNNPLLTAVKKAFLDPDATEPGPNPNPGELPPLPPEAPPPASSPSPPAPVPSDQLSYTNVAYIDWTTGYCAHVTISDNGSTSGSFTIEVPFDDTITSLWDGVYSRTSSSLLVSGPAWDPVIHPGQPRTVSYCATRANRPPPPPPPSPVPADQLSYTSVVDASWPTGYCATITVNNNGSTSGSWTIEVPFGDTIDSLWNGEYSRTPSSLILRGPWWDPVIHPGQPRTVGYCATLGDGPPQAGPANVTGTIAVVNDWGSGWYAEATVVNTGGSIAVDWTLTLPMPAAGTITGLYNAQYTRSGDELTLRGLAANPSLAAGESLRITMTASR